MLTGFKPYYTTRDIILAVQPIAVDSNLLNDNDDSDTKEIFIFRL